MTTVQDIERTINEGLKTIQEFQKEKNQQKMDYLHQQLNNYKIEGIFYKLLKQISFLKGKKDD